MNSNTPASKSQKRLLTLAGITIEKDAYVHASAALAAAGYREDGIPAGHTWRTAAALSDSELVATCKPRRDEVPPYVEYE